MKTEGMEEVGGVGGDLKEMVPGQFIGASNEIRKFRRMFNAVFELGEQLENVALLDQAISERRRKFEQLKAEQEAILAPIKEQIRAAESKLEELNTKAVSDHEVQVALLNRRYADARSVLEAEIETARAERDALLESNRNAAEQLKKRSDELYTVETRYRQIKEKLYSIIK